MPCLMQLPADAAAAVPGFLSQESGPNSLGGVQRNVAPPARPESSSPDQPPSEESNVVPSSPPEDDSAPTKE